MEDIEINLTDQVPETIISDPFVSRSRLISSGFTKSNCTEEVVMFVNAGGEVSVEANADRLSADKFFHGGDVFQTKESIVEAGDYPFIYQSARLGNFCYRFTSIDPGEYFVDLHFVEIINTCGRKGMRVFNVFIQDEKVLSDFDIFSVVGANKPLQLIDSRVSVKDDGVVVIRFEGVYGSSIVSGICIRRAPRLEGIKLHNEVQEAKGSLNFATRVRGVELGPVRKQIDTAELQKVKMMLDKAKQEPPRSKDESLRKPEDSLQNFENKAKGKDQLYRTQLEKIKELEEQLVMKGSSTLSVGESFRKIEAGGKCLLRP